MNGEVAIPDGYTYGLIWHKTDHNGTRTIRAFRVGGRLAIDCTDTGALVERLGRSEYRFDWTAEANQVPKIVAILGGALGDDPVPLLAKWVQENNGDDPGGFLNRSGVKLRFRVRDD